MPRVLNFKKILSTLRAFYAKERRLPGYNEMLVIFNYRSKNSIFQVLRVLENQGYLVKGPRGKIAPTAKFVGSIRNLGTVQAGIPVDVEQVEAPAVELDHFLAPNPEQTFLLQVRGDSMIDAHIAEGDFVLVEATPEANPGDIVVACVDNEWTLKYLDRDNQGFFFRPANKKFSNIRPKESLRIGGVVRSVIRNFR